MLYVATAIAVALPSVSFKRTVDLARSVLHRVFHWHRISMYDIVWANHIAKLIFWLWLQAVTVLEHIARRRNVLYTCASNN